MSRRDRREDFRLSTTQYIECPVCGGQLYELTLTSEFACVACNTVYDITEVAWHKNIETKLKEEIEFEKT